MRCNAWLSWFSVLTALAAVLTVAGSAAEAQVKPFKVTGEGIGF